MSANAPLGLYVHWPYCARICPYCDFNVALEKGRDTDALVNAICADIAHWGEADISRSLVSLSFGGGTPSRLTPKQMQQIIETAKAVFGFAPDAEIMLEANPLDVTGENCADWKSLGVNRLSMGVQSLHDDALAFLGRDHDRQRALAAVETAQAAFSNVSLDLIYGLPDQTPESWAAELREALQMDLPHYSLYALTIEPGTSFFKRHERGQLPVPDGDGFADLYAVTQDLCGQTSVPAYEVSNHARSEEFRSRHNLLYWTGGDWIGVGPGAHGRWRENGVRKGGEALRNIAAYVQSVGDIGTGLSEVESLTPDDDLTEQLLMGLRLTDGLDLPALEARTGAHIDRKRLVEAISDGWVTQEGNIIRVCDPLLTDRIGVEILEG